MAQKIFNQLPFSEQALLLKYFYYSFGHKKENLQKLEPGATASTTLIKIIYLIYKTYNILLLSLCLIIYIYLYLYSSSGLFTLVWWNKCTWAWKFSTYPWKIYTRSWKISTHYLISFCFFDLTSDFFADCGVV